MSDYECLNEATYRQDAVVDAYASQDSLQPGEAAVVGSLGDLGGMRMLDIGVGAGRTTYHFAPQVKSYVGIDYSPELVRVCRQRVPDADISIGDARDLTRFSDDTFDLVMFSFNGIDYVSDSGRRQVLSEVRRVLAPGGAFIFSSHNRDYDRIGLLPWQERRPGRAILRHSVTALLHTLKRRSMRRRELVTADYALVNDEAHDWALITYYVTSDAQVRQLEAAGFLQVQALDQWGALSNGDSESIWRHYVGR